MLTRSLGRALKVHVPTLGLKLGDCGNRTFEYPALDRPFSPTLPVASLYKFGVEDGLNISIPSGSFNESNQIETLSLLKIENKKEIPLEGTTKKPERSPSLPTV